MIASRAQGRLRGVHARARYETRNNQPNKTAEKVNSINQLKSLRNCFSKVLISQVALNCLDLSPSALTRPKNRGFGKAWHLGDVTLEQTHEQTFP